MRWLHRFLSGLKLTSIVLGVSTKIPVAESSRKGTERPAQLLGSQEDLMGVLIAPVTTVSDCS